MKVNIDIYIALILLGLSPTASEDPCLDARDIGSPYRSVANAEQPSGAPLCDSNVITTGGEWVRFIQYNGEEMPESCVPGNLCGTQSPIWMNGTHPTVVGIEVEAMACTHIGITSDCCDVKASMKVKLCEEAESFRHFYVYHILPPTGCPIAYCAGQCTLDQYWHYEQKLCLEFTTKADPQTTASLSSTAPIDHVTQPSTLASTSRSISSRPSTLLVTNSSVSTHTTLSSTEISTAPAQYTTQSAPPTASPATTRQSSTDPDKGASSTTSANPGETRWTSALDGTTSTADTQQSSKIGAIVGITIAIVIAIALATGVIVVVYNREIGRRNDGCQNGSQHNDDSQYDKLDITAMVREENECTQHPAITANGTFNHDNGHSVTCDEDPYTAAMTVTEAGIANIDPVLCEVSPGNRLEESGENATDDPRATADNTSCA